MADFTINVTVTHAGGSIYDWAYSIFDNIKGIAVSSIEIPYGSKHSMEIVLNGGAGSCVFPSGVKDSLTFYTPKGSIGLPLWLENLQMPSRYKLTFDDHNINQKRRSYHFVINAIYDEASITSPDPTIVNVGTEGLMTFIFPKPRSHQPQPAQPDPMAVAV
jgi:hypothetical protein